MSAEPPTDYYNLEGKHIKHVDDGKTDKVMVITFATAKEVDAVNAAIDKGYVMSQFTDDEIAKMDKIYTYHEKEKKEMEQGFLRGINGISSIIVSSEEG